MKPFKYIDTIRTKKGKLRTWSGHNRAICKATGYSINKREKDAFNKRVKDYREQSLKRVHGRYEL